MIIQFQGRYTQCLPSVVKMLKCIKKGKACHVRKHANITMYYRLAVRNNTAKGQTFVPNGSELILIAKNFFGPEGLGIDPHLPEANFNHQKS